MLVGIEGIVRNEQYRDLEREADRERLIRQARGRDKEGTPSARGMPSFQWPMGIAAILAKWDRRCLDGAKPLPRASRILAVLDGGKNTRPADTETTSAL
jgi:hypothetical protein